MLFGIRQQLTMIVHRSSVGPTREGKCSPSSRSESWHRNLYPSSQEYSSSFRTTTEKNGRRTSAPISTILYVAGSSDDRIRILGSVGTRLHADGSAPSYTHLEQDPSRRSTTTKRCCVAQHCSRTRCCATFRVSEAFYRIKPI